MTTTSAIPSGSLISTVIWVFGVLEERSELPFTFLVRVFGALGIRESTARSGLSRAVASGALTRRRTGGRVSLALAPAIRAALDRSIQRQAVESRPAWDGRLHAILYHVPEKNRAYRDSLRYAARGVGYGPLNNGLMVCPWDRWSDLADLPEHVPAGGTVTRGTLTLSPEDAAALAVEAWGLPARADEMRRQVRLIQEHVRSAPDPTPTPQSLRAYVELTLPGFAALALDPDLPPALLPDDWPLPELLVALRRAGGHYGTAVGSYLTELLG